MITTLYDQEVEVFGYLLTLDIDVDFSRDRARGALDRASVGVDTTIEVNGFEFNEEAALDQLLRCFIESGPIERPMEMVVLDEEDIRAAIAAGVQRVVDALDDDEFNEGDDDE